MKYKTRPIYVPEASNLGKLHIETADASKVGSCNFCTDNSLTVYQLSGQRTMIRICINCFNQLQKHVKEEV